MILESIKNSEMALINLTEIDTYDPGPDMGNL
jgi:hypothetical protein